MTEKAFNAGSPSRPYGFRALTPSGTVLPDWKVNSCPIHPDAPAGGGGLGKFKSALLLGLHPEMDR